MNAANNIMPEVNVGIIMNWTVNTMTKPKTEFTVWLVPNVH